MTTRRAPRRVAASKADMKRAIEAIKESGGDIARVLIRPGEVEIIAGLPSAEPPAELSALDQWRAKKNARRAAKGS